MRLLVIAGAVAVVVGGVAIWLGVPVKEFSFGNTMILAGAMAICSGLVLIGLGMVVRELKSIRRSLQEAAKPADRRETEGPPLPAGSIAGWGGRTERDAFEARPVIPEGRTAAENLAPPGLRGESVSSPDGRDGSGSDAAGAGIESGKLTAEVAPPVPSPVKGRRDLLFSSSRREREKARAATLEAPDTPPVAAAAEPATGSAARRRAEPHPSFNRAPSFGQDSAPVERAADADLTPSRRAGLRAPPPPPAPEAPAVTVVKSGAVDGMAYSLYSDGSIEAQMPEGMMRFASIEHLRAHLDRDR
ncbi:MAG: DUF308 domain-containing protein [Xanthobacteraceae bacterium]|nr:DUF308 domain-containing protein [Xanthobacteraceae bacterium]